MSATDLFAKDSDPTIAARDLFRFDKDNAPLEAGSVLEVPGAKAFPQAHIYWARKGDDEATKTQIGYRYPTLDEIEALGLRANTIDNKVQMGHDMVLMICSHERFMAHRKLIAERSESRLNGHAAKVKNDIETSNATGGKADGEITLN